MRLGEALVRLAALHPHYFNSFYRRVRVIREAPRPMAAAATVDVTHRCALRCPFCIAADILEHRDMPLPSFRAVCDALAGIDRLTLIGGEPFQHPDLPALVERARRTAREVEVFTNGLALGSRPEDAARRLRDLLPDADRSWLTLVLSVDPGHANQMSPGRLQRVVDGLLEAEEAGLCTARFSVTHDSLATGIYLDTDTVTRAIGEVAPRLADLFMARLLDGRVQGTFYFNSVICAQPPADRHGDATVAGMAGPEVLRLEDLAFSPEVALSFDREGEPRVFTSLASMWSSQPPPRTVLGTLEEAGDELLRRSVEDDRFLAGWLLQDNPTVPAKTHRGWRDAMVVADSPASRDRLLRAYLPFHRLIAWDGGRALARAQVRVPAGLIAAGIGDRVLRWGGEEGEGTLDGVRLRALLDRCAVLPGEEERLADGIARDWHGRFGLDGAGPRAPVYAGARELLGKRVPQAPGERQPLDRVHLPQEPGFSDRDELVVRPVVEWYPDGRRFLRFPGIEPGTDDRPAAVAAALLRLLEMVSCAGGTELAHKVHQRLPAPLQELAGPPAGERPPAGLRPDDLAGAFHECTFDRNRQRADEDNPELLAILLAYAHQHFPAAAVRTFRSRALTWLERFAETEPLSAPCRTLLGNLDVRGTEKKRLDRLLR